VDVPGGRGQGVIPILQFEGKTPKVGDEVEFDIEGYDAANGLLKLTMQGAAQVITDWSAVTTGMVVEARVTGVNKNRTGLLVEVNGLKGFMPISQIDLYRVEKPEDYINQRLKCVVSELNPAERNLVLSRRTLLEREREEQREQFWAGVEEGQVRTGIVRGLKPFGAFVDLGGADGLIPISELSWSRIGDPSEVVQIGQRVEVKIARLDREARKIGLSLKQLVRGPWDDFVTQNRTGTRLVGKVTRIAEFGAFVEVAPGIEGLIHVSELSTQRVRRVRDVLQEGQEVTVQVLSVDPENRRVSLSLKALTAELEAADLAAEEAEREEDLRTAEDRMTGRPVNPNLRGGIGGGPIQFDR
jgi:small subunit ribosomal protein S1